MCFFADVGNRTENEESTGVRRWLECGRVIETKGKGVGSVRRRDPHLHRGSTHISCNTLGASLPKVKAPKNLSMINE